MVWQGAVLRLGSATAWFRARLRPRAIARTAILAATVGFLLIAIEAAVRARVVPPDARLPTALYSRPDPWGNEPDRGGAVPIGPVRGDLGEHRVPADLEDLPDHLMQAVLAVEDQRFYEHHGLDLRRIAGALVANVKAGGIVQGGSTVTQQLAKNLFLSARRSPLRKLREAAMALVLELRHDKATILAAYLNEIYLGHDGRRAIHGVGAAARYYFGKDARRLTLPESALLAGMIRAPNWYTPVRHPREARERRDLVLRLMVQQSRVSQRAADRAIRERVPTRPGPAPTLDARYFRDFVSAGLGGLPGRGVRVYTTLDATLQRAAERAVMDGLRNLGADGAQAALVALDPRTGDVLALVGGADYGATQFNRATDARRQPGSAFKPLVALAALGRADGEPAFTLASALDDEPLSVATPAGRWEPANYDRRFRGSVTFREALEQSLNVPFARIGLAIGPERIRATARRLGVASPLRPVPSLALGSSEVTLLELARAYGVLATGGDLAATRVLLGRRTAGQPLREAGAPRIARVADPAEVYLVTSALEGAVQRGTGAALDAGGWGGGIAGKSGTSNDWRDAWFVAYTTELVVGAWVGHDDGRSLRRTGAQAALPIVARLLREALRLAPAEPFPMPDGVEIAPVGPAEHGWLGWYCDGPEEVFLEGTAPEGQCEGSGFRRWRTGRGEDWVAVLEEQARELADRLRERFSEERRRW
jgi:penicillin-binding protein 1B